LKIRQALSLCLGGAGLWVLPCGAAPLSKDEGSTAEIPATVLELGSYYRFLGGVGYGRGLRFNNPYRLQTQLGETPESLSLTAPYLDVWAGAALGAPHGISHGLAVHASFAISGIAQEVIAPGYLAIAQVSPRWLVTARGALPIVLEPDANVGGEVAAGAIVLLTAGAGLSAELVGSLFFGAATLDTPRTAIPLLSLQIGAIVDYEVLP
jgi:hypothetical protein